MIAFPRRLVAPWGTERERRRAKTRGSVEYDGVTKQVDEFGFVATMAA